MKLKEFLSKYNEYNCPDNYYEAWLILFANRQYKNRADILKYAEIDMKEQLNSLYLKFFNENRVKLEDIHKGNTAKRNSLRYSEAKGRYKEK